jgi:hypothetical protein
MLTESELKRWASLMLISALRGHARPEYIKQQINMVRAHHGAAQLEKMLEAVLLEAVRLGPLHSDGSLYHAPLKVKTLI